MFLSNEAHSFEIEDALFRLTDNINFPYFIRCDCWAITIRGNGENTTRRLIYPNQR